MLLSEKLYRHLLEIDETAQSRLEQMMPQLAKEAPAILPSVLLFWDYCLVGLNGTRFYIRCCYPYPTNNAP